MYWQGYGTGDKSDVALFNYRSGGYALTQIEGVHLLRKIILIDEIQLYQRDVLNYIYSRNPYCIIATTSGYNPINERNHFRQAW